MRCRRLLACGVALGLLAASAPAPISLRSLDGAEVLVARGPQETAVVLHFWASWCTDCIEELPALARAARACEPVRVIAVNVGESAERVRAHLAEHAIALPVLLDPDGRAWRKAGLWGIPSNLFWTADGVRTRDGPSSEADWRAWFAGQGCDAPRQPAD